MQDKKDLLFLTSLRIWSEIPVGALEEMTIRATSQNACQSARCSRQHCKHTMLGKYINNSSQKDTTVKELLLSRLRRRSSSDLFPLALYFSFFHLFFSPCFFLQQHPKRFWAHGSPVVRFYQWVNSTEVGQINTHILWEERGETGAVRALWM